MFQTLMKTFLIILILQFTLSARDINVNTSIADAKASHKHLFVWLHKTNCGYCESMQDFTLENEKVKAFIGKNFLFVHINVSQKDTIIYKDFIGSGRSFAKKMGYDFYPTSLFFDDEANVILAEVGYIDSQAVPNDERFYTILQYIDSRQYKKMDFSDYEFSLKEEL